MPVNVFYSPELETPPMAPECMITFSFIVAASEGETTRVQLHDGLNQNIPDEYWEKILEKEVTQRMIKTGSLRVVKDSEIPEVLEEDDLKTEGTTKELDLSQLSVTDANTAISKIHDIPALLKMQETEKRTPVRSAITRRITALSS